MQIPPGPKDFNCHRCLPKKVPMAKVCHTCKLWKKLEGKDPNTGDRLDHWACTDEWLLTGLLEIAKTGISVAAATESFRNEVVDRADKADAMRRVAQFARGGPAPLMIEGD
jgi:hypothetical protein